MADERVRERQPVLAADALIRRVEAFEVAAQAKQVLWMILAARRPVQRIDRNDAAATERLGPLDREIGGGLPLELVLRLELDARDHGAVDVPASPEGDRGFERFDPALVADEAVLARADLREQRLRPHLEVETGVLHELFAVERLERVGRQRARAERHRDALVV